MFLRNDEDEAEEKYKSIRKDLNFIQNNPNLVFNMHQFITSTFAYKFKHLSGLIFEIQNCLSTLDIENINYTYLSVFLKILQNFLENEENISKKLKNKNINDLVLSKEEESLKVPQNLQFIYQSLLEKNLISKISYVDYLKYLDIIDKNKEDEEKKDKTDFIEDSEEIPQKHNEIDEIMITISNNEK